MLSVYLQEPGSISTRDIPQPTPGPGEALVRIRAAGICGSDIGAFNGTNPLVSYPRVLGHELAGEVVSIPENDKGIKPGDHVVADPYLYCGKCYPCSLGRTNCCTGLKVLGVHTDGGMAEYFAHPAHMLVKLPPDMDWALAAMAEPLTIALHGLHRAGLSAGEHVAISGAGPIGLLAAMAAIQYGAVPVLIDPLEGRLAKARELGIPHTSPPGEAAQALLEDLTHGRMAEAVMEASGAHAAVKAALQLVSFAGRVSLTGWPKGEIPLDTALITRKELDVRGARNSAGEFEEAIRLIHGGRVNAKGILSGTVPAGKLPHMVRQTAAEPEKHLKTVGLFF